MIDYEMKKFDLDYNYQITTEMILKLMQGKRLHFQMNENSPRFTFHPPESGVFISDKQYHALRAYTSNGQEYIFHQIEND